MLASSFNHTIDAKNRLFIPAKFREKLGNEIVISQALRGRYLNVYSTAEWEKYLEPIKKMDRAESEPILRFLNGTSLTVTLDGTGRVQLTPELIDYANIQSKQIVIVGCGDYAEIWSDKDYKEKVLNVDKDRLISLLERVGL